MLEQVRADEIRKMADAANYRQFIDAVEWVYQKLRQQ